MTSNKVNWTVINSDNYNAAGIETMFFPGGEPHVKLKKDYKSQNVLLYLKLRTWNDVGIAACLLDSLNYYSASDSLVAFVPYFPGARQDKGMPDTLGVVARTLGYNCSIDFFDGHSSAVLNTVHGVEWMPRDLDIPTKDDVAGIIAPDEGAYERAGSFRDKFYPNVSLIYCTKKRDQRTGALSNYVMPEIPRPGRYIVVDDICDGGGTFNLLADAFIQDINGKKSKLELFVSHGIFSKGLANLSTAYEHITTTDSWCQLKSSDRLTVVSLSPILDLIMDDFPVQDWS